MYILHESLYTVYNSKIAHTVVKVTSLWFKYLIFDVEVKFLLHI